MKKDDNGGRGWWVVQWDEVRHVKACEKLGNVGYRIWLDTPRASDLLPSFTTDALHKDESAAWQELHAKKQREHMALLREIAEIEQRRKEAWARDFEGAPR